MKGISSLKYVFLILAAVAVYSPQASIAAVKQFVEGEAWLSISAAVQNTGSDAKSQDQAIKVQKTYYLRGIYDGLKAEGITGNKRSKLLAKIPAWDPEKMIKELDEFYIDDNNKVIPVINALMLINEKMRGLPQDKMQRNINVVREANLNEDEMM